MWYLLTAAGIFWLDYELKEYMDRKLSDTDEEKAFGGRILLRKVYNRGAMLGFLKDHQPLLVKGSVLLAALLTGYWLVLLCRKGQGFLKLALSFLTGGALSNVYDRIIRSYVVDYFSFNVKWKQLRRVVFNLSDLFIFVGSVMIVLYSFLKKEIKDLSGTVFGNGDCPRCIKGEET